MPLIENLALSNSLYGPIILWDNKKNIKIITIQEFWWKTLKNKTNYQQQEKKITI